MFFIFLDLATIKSRTPPRPTPQELNDPDFLYYTMSTFEIENLTRGGNTFSTKRKGCITDIEKLYLGKKFPITIATSTNSTVQAEIMLCELLYDVIENDVIAYYVQYPNTHLNEKKKTQLLTYDKIKSMKEEPGMEIPSTKDLQKILDVHVSKGRLMKASMRKELIWRLRLDIQY